MPGVWKTDLPVRVPGYLSVVWGPARGAVGLQWKRLKVESHL